MAYTRDPPSATATPPSPPPNSVLDMEQVMLRYAGAKILPPVTATIDAATFALVPEGMKLQDLAGMLPKIRTEPVRRTGTAKMQDLESFIAHVTRFKDADSVVFCDQRDQMKPELTAVIDYHRAGHESAPRFGVHRAHYACPPSEAWSAWRMQHDKPLSQDAFAELIETRIADLLVPPLPTSEDPGDQTLITWVRTMGTRFADAATMLELSRGLAVRETARVKNAITLASGEQQMLYESEHTNEVGAPLTIPGAFLLGLPVFDRGAAYRVPVRLRYRLSEGRVSWRYILHRPDLVFRDALDDALGQVRKATALPVLIGTPEA